MGCVTLDAEISADPEQLRFSNLQIQVASPLIDWPSEDTVPEKFSFSSPPDSGKVIFHVTLSAEIVPSKLPPVEVVKIVNLLPD